MIAALGRKEWHLSAFGVIGRERAASFGIGRERAVSFRIWWDPAVPFRNKQVFTVSFGIWWLLVVENGNEWVLTTSIGLRADFMATDNGLVGFSGVITFSTATNSD